MALIRPLLCRLYDQFGQRLDEVTWLDDSTRAQAKLKWSLLEKVRTTFCHLRFPACWGQNIAYDSDWSAYPSISMTGVLPRDVLAARSFNLAQALALVGQYANRGEI